MSESLLCAADNSQLVVIDIQTRLAGAMAEEARERVYRNSAILLQAAAQLDIPAIATEQYPKGLGPTEASVAAHFPAAMPLIEKTCFACSANDHFMQALADNHRRQVVLAGMEAHVCVLQTALELQNRGYQVFVVEDAVCSRRAAHQHNALQRLRQAGVLISNTESVLFEWLRDARHRHFKAVTALIK